MAPLAPLVPASLNMDKICGLKSHLVYRISSYNCRGNYSFLEVEVRQVFKGGNYSKEETIVFLLFVKKRISIDIALFHAI